MSETEQETIERINAARAAAGLPALRPVAELTAAARRHAADIAAHPYLVHTGSDGSDGGRRMREAGYAWQEWGEVVGWGFSGDARRMVDWWMNSPGHRLFLLDGNMRDVGVGYVAAPESEWGHYWVADFGRRDGEIEPPTPHTIYAPVVVTGGGTAPVGAPTSGAIDLLPYLAGDGRAYRVGNARGSFEVFQTQREGDRFYQVKAWDDLSVVNWEEFLVLGDTIGRDVDTSPGGGRFYRQFGAPWVGRRMVPGESFSQRKRLQFYQLTDCAESAANSNEVTDTITLVARYERYTFRARDWQPVTLADVVKLRWEEGGEVYFFARDYGLVAWEREHQDPLTPAWSAICEMRPNVGTLRRLRIPCLDVN